MKELVMNLNFLGQRYQEVFRFPYQLKDLKKPWTIQNYPRTAEVPLFGVQADKEVSLPPVIYFQCWGENTEEEERGRRENTYGNFCGGWKYY